MLVVYSGYYLVSLALNFADNKKIIIIITIKNFSTLLAFDSADYSSLSGKYFCSLSYSNFRSITWAEKVATNTGYDFNINSMLQQVVIDLFTDTAAILN